MSFLSKTLIVSVPSSLTRIYYPWIADCRVRNYAARKGTRDRKQKKKVKIEEKKQEFVPHNERNKEKFLLNRKIRKIDDSWKQTPIDDVYVQRYYMWKVYSFAEAIECHRETHHPDIYNQPNAPLHVAIELDMTGEKKTRFLDNFTRIASMPYKFDHGEERTILAFAKDTKLQEDAKKAGAHLVGGVDLIKEIQNGGVSLQDFQYFIAHPNILPELVSLRGLMKRKFPNPKSGTLSTDLANVVARFLDGITYSAVKDEYEKDFGIIETSIGTLNMDVEHLESNFASLVKDVNEAKPKRDGPFINRCLMLSPPSREKFKIDHTLYLIEEKKEVANEDDEKDAVAV